WLRSDRWEYRFDLDKRRSGMRIGPLFLAYISSDQTLTSGLGAQHGASRCLTNSLLIRFCQRTFRKEKLVVFAAPSHPLARKKQLSFSDLRQAPLVTTGMATAVDKMLNHLVHSRGGYANGPRLNASYRIGCPRSPRLALSSRMSISPMNSLISYLSERFP